MQVTVKFDELEKIFEDFFVRPECPTTALEEAKKLGALVFSIINNYADKISVPEQYLPLINELWEFVLKSIKFEEVVNEPASDKPTE